MKIDGRLFMVLTIVLALIPGACAVSSSLDGGTSVASTNGQVSGIAVASIGGTSLTGTFTGATFTAYNWLDDAAKNHVDESLNVVQGTGNYIFQFKKGDTVVNPNAVNHAVTTSSSVTATQQLTITSATSVYARASASNKEGDNAWASLDAEKGSVKLLGYNNYVKAASGQVTATESATSVRGNKLFFFDGALNNENDHTQLTEGADSYLDSTFGTITGYSTSVSADKTHAAGQTLSSNAVGNDVWFAGRSWNGQDPNNPNLANYDSSEFVEGSGSLIGYANSASATISGATSTQTLKSAYDSGTGSYRGIGLNNRAWNKEGDISSSTTGLANGQLVGYVDRSTSLASSTLSSKSINYAAGDSIETSTQANGKGNQANVNVNILFGSVTGDKNSATATKTQVSASQTAISGAANSINIYDSAKDSSGTYSVNTPLKGTFTGLSETASAGTTTQVVQKEHVHGTFTSTATFTPTTGTVKTKTRTSNYGTEYDINMKAAKGSLPTGTLGYYVKPGTTASKIQGGVNAAQSGDTVNVAAGKYLEKVKIDKSLAINGAGRYSTIVDGNKLDEVFLIGSVTPNIDVTLSGLGITGGSAYYGGGILNCGRTTIKNSLIFGNVAFSGAGIANEGTVTITGSTISGNSADGSGAGIENYGTVSITGSTISGNSAEDGSGICNFGTATISSSTIIGNSAFRDGGGIYNDGTATVSSSTISGNSAADYGSGIWNYGTAIIKDSGIFLNIADSDANGIGTGGGIYKYAGNLIFQDLSGNIITDPNVISSMVFSNYLKSIGGTLSNIEP